jgi:hypothetical protein
MAETSTAEPRIVSGDLTWAIRVSFVRYVNSAGGTVSLAPPATWTGEHFVFPLVERSEDEFGVLLAFGGEVAMAAYEGMLNVQVADPSVLITGGVGILTAANLARSERYVLADLTLRTPDARVGPVEFDAALHESAVGLFGGVYEPGAPLDTLYLRGQSVDGKRRGGPEGLHPPELRATPETIV